VQENEKEKGQTFVQETTKYTGLIGLVLNTKTKELPGYEPVVKPVVIEKPHFREDSVDLTGGTPHESQGDESRGTPHESEGDYDDYIGDPEADNYPPDSYYYQWLINNCLSNNGYWYNNTCNVESENSPSTGTPDESQGDESAGIPHESQEDESSGSSDESQENFTNEGTPDESQENSPSVFTCDADHPTLCDAQEICEDMNLYWYNGECNIEEDFVEENLENFESETSENSSDEN
ncbi:MAG: hypothetical protein KAR20_03950, partial [Candidatus Heimdallarchaeota archaeon]|nr:hypothetical protein [Candidatus Heimdallarchaeota archaeon]